MKRLYNYETGSDYQPLEVMMEIIPPVFITSPWVHFDGLLAYLCTRDALEELFYCMPSEKTIDTSMIDLPFKKTEDVNHSSVGQYDGAYLYKNTIYKRFSDNEIRVLTKKQNKGRVHTDRGYYKDFMINIPLLLTNSIVFYCNADKNELGNLLKNLTQIGKKTSIGGGRIQNININEIDQDYSFFKEGRIMRPVPANIKLPIVEGLVFSNLPYKPPYWNKSHVKMCYSPESQIKIGE